VPRGASTVVQRSSELRIVTGPGHVLRVRCDRARRTGHRAPAAGEAPRAPREEGASEAARTGPVLRAARRRASRADPVREGAWIRGPGRQTAQQPLRTWPAIRGVDEDARQSRAG